MEKKGAYVRKFVVMTEIGLKWKIVAAFVGVTCRSYNGRLLTVLSLLDKNLY